MSDPLNVELHKQFLAEHGGQHTPEHRQDHLMAAGGRVTTYDSGCTGCRAFEAMNLLRQKFGLMPPLLTERERWGIYQERKRAAL